MKRFLTTYVLRELQSKTTKKYHYPPITMAKIQKTNNKCWKGYKPIGTLLITGKNEK